MVWGAYRFVAYNEGTLETSATRVNARRRYSGSGAFLDFSGLSERGHELPKFSPRARDPGAAGREADHPRGR